MKANRLFVIGILLLGALLSACAGAAVAQELTPTPVEGESQPAPAEPVTRTITVSGRGTAVMTPDIAYVNIGVRTENADAAEAVAENNTRSQAVIDALLGLGIAEQDIRTTNFSIFPQQDFDPEGQPREVRYIVDNTVYVTVRDLETIGEVLNTAVEAGANSIYGIQFDVADKTEALSAARQQAVTDARTIAEELAEAAGVELGTVQTINQTVGTAPPPVYFDRAVAESAAASVPISAGEMQISVEVSVVYAIQ